MLPRFQNEVQEAFTVEIENAWPLQHGICILVTVGLIFKSLLCRISEEIFCRKSRCGKSLVLLCPIFLLRYRSKITEDFRDITYVL